MPITRKPKPSNGHSKSVDVETLIGRGGSPAGSRAGRPLAPLNSDRGPEMHVVVSIPQSILFEIDALVRGRPVKTSRRRWMLEALHEKMMREKTETHRRRLSD
jgi:hypothetical protein